MPRNLTLLLFALASLGVAARDLRAEDATPPLETVEVSGERAGPAMWRVSKDDHVLWIFGTLAPLPERMTWRSAEVERVLGEVQFVLAGGASASIDGGPITMFRLYREFKRTQRLPAEQRLQELLDADDYARFSSLRNRYAKRNDDIERYRPMFAAFTLFNAGVKASGLSNDDDIQKRVLKLARRHGVKRQQIELEIDEPYRLLAQISVSSPQSEIVCLNSAMNRLERDLGDLRARALAWAEGDVERLRNLRDPSEREACFDAFINSPRIKALVESARTQWIEAAVKALETHSASLALTNINGLWGPRSLLEEFRRRGYRVEGP